MKKLIIVVMILIFAFAYGELAEKRVLKEVDYVTGGINIKTVSLKYAKQFDERYLFTGTIYNADSTYSMDDACFWDTNAPFTVTTPELDSLLIWGE